MPRDLARNWIDRARHYAALDADAFQVPAEDGLLDWFEELLRRSRSGDAIWLVADIDGRVVGNVSGRIERPNKVAAQGSGGLVNEPVSVVGRLC